MEEAEMNKVIPDHRKWWKVPRRYQVALMCCLAFIINTWISTNLFTNFNYIFLLSDKQRSLQYPIIGNWTGSGSRWLLDLHFWGSAGIQLPAAASVMSFSPYRIMLLTILVSSIVHMVTPFAIYGNVWGIIFLVVIQGITTGPLACACMGMWREWAPTNERTRLLVLSFCGNLIGMYITYPLSHYLVWELGPDCIYYFAGVTGLSWCLLWSTLFSGTPVTDRLITRDELCYLEGSVSPGNIEKIPLRSIPWLSILTSMPVLALGLVFFTSIFLSHVLALTDTLLNEELYIGRYSTLWHVYTEAGICSLLIPMSGFLVDYLVNQKMFQIITMRKIFCCGALTIHAIFLFLSLIPHTLVYAICHMFSFVFLSLSITGYLPNILDLSPPFACIIIAVGSILIRLAAIVFDAIARIFEDEDRIIERSEWKQMFIPCGIFGLVTAAVYAFFASSDEQPWSSAVHRRPKDTIPIQDGEALVSERV